MVAVKVWQEPLGMQAGMQPASADSAEVLPPCTLDRTTGKTFQIVRYLKELLQNVDGQEKTAIVPSPYHLSVFLRCTVFDILESLKTLNREGYEYELYAIDAPILLKEVALISTEDDNEENIINYKAYRRWLSQHIHNA